MLGCFGLFGKFYHFYFFSAKNAVLMWSCLYVKFAFQPLLTKNAVEQNQQCKLTNSNEHIESDSNYLKPQSSTRVELLATWSMVSDCGMAQSGTWHWKRHSERGTWALKSTQSNVVLWSWISGITNQRNIFEAQIPFFEHRTYFTRLKFHA